MFAGISNNHFIDLIIRSEAYTEDGRKGKRNESDDADVNNVIHFRRSH